MSISYSAPALNITLNIIESYGIDPAPLMKQLSIDASRMLDPNARFDYRKIDRLWFDAQLLAQDPAFGLRAAKYWHPSHMGALGYAWLASSSLRTALERLQRYMSILTEGATLALEETSSELSVHLKYKAISRQQPTRTDSFMAMLLAMCRANCGENFYPSAVYLAHEAPADAAAFYALFGEQVYFGAAENRFHVARSISDKRLASANPRLAQLSDQITIETLARLERDNIVAQVKTEILNQLASGSVTDVSVAQGLNLSPRSLQRKLQGDNTTFKTLLNVLREELAKKYLKDSNTRLVEIAFMLGYAEYSSFSRAFKRWTGVSPKAYRGDVR
ncbi:MAG TPA: AraC family transcriptional regulator [Thiotrichales bacterium]|nr:AraC family transcriptional regulator [Thiotrichales bacterium]